MRPRGGPRPAGTSGLMLAMGTMGAPAPVAPVSVSLPSLTHNSIPLLLLLIIPAAAADAVTTVVVGGR